jgi:hypothetical protein
MNRLSFQQQAVRRVTFYPVLLVFLTGATFVFTMSMQGTPLGSLLILWTPALAVLLARLFTRRSFKDIGWGGEIG